MHNETIMVCLGCEGIMIGERELAHKLTRSSPRKSVLDDSVVSGSGNL